ncbi:MAG: hypothetical protein H6850_03550 [Alphaproteobacteria bacterium]|nr:MAG: hypothetical protein H6850_03550 [Alphaproteobacteria bacterium]
MFINDQDAFDRWLKSFNPSFYVGIDVEFIRKDTFFPIVCLFQISSIEETVVIDPLTVDIKPLLEKINTTDILKLFFSGRQDMEAIFYQYDILLSPIFDLQIACDFLRYRDSASLSEVILDVCHIEIDKEHQSLDWRKRPLQETAIQYAYNDAHYLIPIYKNFKKKLKEKHRYNWVLEESAVIFSQITDLGLDYFKKNFFHPKNRYLDLKRELVLWREHYARFKNIPRRRVYKDMVIHNMTPDTMFWDCHIPRDMFLHMTGKDVIQFQRMAKRIFKIAKQNDIPKRYMNYPFEIAKLVKSPLEKNVFLEGWRNVILKDELTTVITS